jgi:acyl carrier protein
MVLDLPALREILETVTGKAIDSDSLREDTSYLDDLGLTSIQIVDLAMALEDRYDIEIEDVDLARIRTVGQTIAYVKTKTQDS